MKKVAYLLLALSSLTLSSCRSLLLARVPNSHSNKVIEADVVEFGGKRYAVRRYVVHTQPYETHTELAEIPDA